MEIKMSFSRFKDQIWKKIPEIPLKRQAFSTLDGIHNIGLN